MSEYNDKITNRERLYVWATPALFALGFAAFLLSFILNITTQFDIDGVSNNFNDFIGALLFGYFLSCESTIIHFLLNKIRVGSSFVKALLAVLFIPAMIAGVFGAAILTIPYYIFCIKKIKQIKIDDSILLLWQKISLFVLALSDVAVLILYIVLK